MVISLFGSCGFGFLLGVPPVETIDAPRSIDQLLLTGKERMAGRTNFHVQVVFACGSSLKGLAAGAGNCYIDVFWVDSWFHLTLPIGGSEPHFQTGYDRGLSADRQVWARIGGLLA